MKKEKKPRDKSVVREYFELIAETAVFVFFVMTFVVQAFQIPTGSMEPTLLIGDFLLVNKLVYSNPKFSLEKTILPRRDLRRQDIVVFKYPKELTKDFVKRIIALEGEKVEIRDKQVYINDEPIPEPYKFHKPEFFGLTAEDFGPVQVPEGYYFAMGDNRDNSKDSRAWGFVPKDYIKGRAFLIYWSFEGPQNVGGPVGDKLKGLVNVVVNFIPNTRWKRFFKIIR